MTATKNRIKLQKYPWYKDLNYYLNLSVFVSSLPYFFIAKKTAPVLTLINCVRDQKICFKSDD